MAAAEAWGGPWAAFCPYPIPLSSPDAPRFGLGLPPARVPLGRLRDAAVRPLVMGAVERATLPKVATLHAGLGLPPFRSLDELQTAAPLLIYLTAVPFGRDQFEVARRVEVAGAGARLPASRLAPERLRAKVREAMAVA